MQIHNDHGKEKLCPNLYMYDTRTSPDSKVFFPEESSKGAESHSQKWNPLQSGNDMHFPTSP